MFYGPEYGSWYLYAWDGLFMCIRKKYLSCTYIKCSIVIKNSVYKSSISILSFWSTYFTKYRDRGFEISRCHRKCSISLLNSIRSAPCTQMFSNCVLISLRLRPQIYPFINNLILSGHYFFINRQFLFSFI